MKVRSRPATVPTCRVASPIGAAATAVATSANAAPKVQCRRVVSAMISRLRFTRASIRDQIQGPPAGTVRREHWLVTALRISSSKAQATDCHADLEGSNNVTIRLGEALDHGQHRPVACLGG